MSINKAMLLGNVCADPKTNTFQDGSKIAQVRLATNKPEYTKADGTKVPGRAEYHNIVLRGRLAEVAEKYVHKGDKLFIEGELHTREYEADGQKRYVTEIYASSMEMLTPKQKSAAAPAQAPIDEPLPW